MARFTVHLPVKQFIAELLGTAFLVMAVGSALAARNGGSDAYSALFIPFAAGLAIMLGVYLFADISGGHFNPAVTLGLFVYRKVTLIHLVLYWVAQVTGAVLGSSLVRYMTGEYALGPRGAGAPTVVGEFIGAFLLVLTVTKVVQGKVSSAVGGLVIGLAVMIGASMTLVADSGLFNPALALGLGSYSYIYLLIPLIGGVAGAGLATLLGEPAQ